MNIPAAALVWLNAEQQHSNTAWFTRIKQNLEYEYYQGAAESGTKLSSKAPYVPVDHIIKMMWAALCTNKAESIYLAHAMLLDYLGVGRYNCYVADFRIIVTIYYLYVLCLLCRGVECAYLNWDSVTFVGTLILTWITIKTRNEKELSFDNAYREPMLDIFLMFSFVFILGNARHLVPTEDSNAGEKWLSNVLAYAPEPTTRINAFLAKLKSSFGLTWLEGVTSHSFRLSALHEIVANGFLQVKHAVYRSGQEYNGICSAFEYVLSCFPLQSQAGNALCGWPDPRRKVINCNMEPIYDFIKGKYPDKEANIEIFKLYKFLQLLFHIDGNNRDFLPPRSDPHSSTGGIIPPGRLWLFVECMFATYLKFAPQVRVHMEKTKVDSFIIFQQFDSTVKQHNFNVSERHNALPYTSSMFREWGEMIQKRFDSDNSNPDAEATTGDYMKQMIADNNSLKAQMRDLLGTITTQTKVNLHTVPLISLFHILSYIHVFFSHRKLMSLSLQSIHFLQP